MAIFSIPRESRMSRCKRTSSRTLTKGNSGPYCSPVSVLIVSGDAEPYGEPRTLAQKIKNFVVSKALFGPIRGPHLQIIRVREVNTVVSRDNQGIATDLSSYAYQSSTSALPVKAWQITITLSAVSFSLPKVFHAIGTLVIVTPVSSVNVGMMVIFCSGIKPTK